MFDTQLIAEVLQVQEISATVFEPYLVHGCCRSDR